MTATVHQYWSPDVGDSGAVWQAIDTTVTWTWHLGDGTYFWAWSVRPLQANAIVSLDSVVAISDQDNNQVTNLTVTAKPGAQFRLSNGRGLIALRFTAIKVQTS
jgi:hypothetical protein